MLDAIGVDDNEPMAGMGDVLGAVVLLAALKKLSTGGWSLCDSRSLSIFCWPCVSVVWIF